MTYDEAEMNRITEVVIGCAFKVHNTLRSGFAERVYANALAHELRKAGLTVEQEKRITVWYDGIVVGEYVADVVVLGSLLIEIKAVRAFDEGHVAQCLNYLAATVIPLCLLLNFGRRVEIRRLRGERQPNTEENLAIDEKSDGHR
jgi:GxxExxY protein